MSSHTFAQGTNPFFFAASPLKVIIFDEATHAAVFQSSPFGEKDLMNKVYKSDRLWYLTENLYNFSYSVDTEVPKRFHFLPLFPFLHIFLFIVCFF